MSDVNVTEAPAAATPAAPASPVATPQAPAAAAPATPLAATPAPATPSSPPSGPEGWVPSYRIRETREAALRESQGQWAAKEADYQARMQQIQNQLHALVGVQPPADPNVAAVKNQFGNLYPGLAKLEERAQDLETLMERAGDLEAQTAHYWQSYGRQAMDRLFSRASDSIGAPLTDEGKRQLHASFTGWVSSSPELSARYASDPTIVDDYWKAFTSSFIDPIRRTTAAGVQDRVPGAIPRDTPGGAPRATPAPQPGNLDDRVKVGWARFNEIVTNK